MDELERIQQKIITKSNKSVFTIFSKAIGRTHLKIIYSALCQIRPNDDLDKVTYKVYLKALAEDLNYKSKGTYEDILRAADEVQKNSSVRIDNIKGGYSRFNFVRDITHPYKYCPYITVQFDSKIKEHYIGLEKNFTIIIYSIMMGLKSYYSMRFYEIFNAYAYQKVLSLKVEFIKEVFDLEDAYKGNFSAFESKVIGSPIEEINAKTNLHITYEKERTGNRVTAFNFTIAKVKHLEPENHLFEILEGTTEELLQEAGIKEEKLIKEFGKYDKEFLEYTIGRARLEHEKKPKGSLKAFTIAAIRNGYYNESFEVLKLKEEQKKDNLQAKERKLIESKIVERIKSEFESAQERFLLQHVKDSKPVHREKYIEYLENEGGGLFKQGLIDDFKAGKREKAFGYWLLQKYADKEATDLPTFAKTFFNVNLVNHHGSFYIVKEKPIIAESA